MQPTISSYQIIHETKLEDVQKKVNELLNDNWQPYGPLNTVNRTSPQPDSKSPTSKLFNNGYGEIYFYQAMVQYQQQTTDYGLKP